MYAIIEDGGRQYKVEEGQELDVDYRDAANGSSLTFEKVVAVSGDGKSTVKADELKAASVTADVLGTVQGPKLSIQKFKRRKGYRRRTGHRQLYTKVKIAKISAG